MANRELETSGGLVTFLFTDVVGSTAAWEAHPDEMGVALARHDDLIEMTVSAHAGDVVRPRGEGDSRFAVFRSPGKALIAATAINESLAGEQWPEGAPITVRTAMHTGPAEHRAGDYYGSAVNRCARLRSIAHPTQILASEVTVNLGRDDVSHGVTFTDLGVHWLKDLASPERVYQVDPEGSVRSFPPLRSLPSIQANLAPVPLPTSSFVGRRDDIDRIVGLVTDPTIRVVTITGPGGVGKTRIAIQVTNEVQQDFSGGIFFVDLTSLSDPNAVPAFIAVALGVAEQPGRSPLDGLVERLASSDTLLVLDNLEQILGAASAIAVLSNRCPLLTVLGTSRAPLRISGEAEHHARPLALPDLSARITAAAAEEDDAMALFVARCQTQRPGFVVTEANARTIAEICVRLDGLPLPLELAAARIKMLDPVRLLARLDQRLDLLVGKERDAPSRQRTLRATLEWSYGLLDDSHQRQLARLSVFAGSFTLESAETVTGLDEDGVAVLDQLGELVDNSLVNAVDESARLRFELLQTVREFAAEKLEASGEGHELRLRHGLDVLSRCEAAAAEVNGPSAPLFFADLRADEGNARAALEFLLVEDPSAAARIAVAMRPFWITHGRLTEGRRWVERILASVGLNHEALGRVLVLGGVLACYQDDYEKGAQLLQDGLDVARSVGDASSIASALCFLGTATLARGDLDGAARLAEEAREAATAPGMYESHVQALSLLAMLAGMSGQFDRETSLHEQRLAETRQQGDAARVADTLNTLAEIALDEEDLDAADRAATEALDMARGTSRLTVRDSLLTIGRVAVGLHDVHRAASAFSDALVYSIEFAQPRELGLCISGAAAVAALSGEPYIAARLHGSAQNIRDSSGDRYPIERDLQAILDAAREGSDPDRFEEAVRAGALLDRPTAVEQASRFLNSHGVVESPSP